MDSFNSNPIKLKMIEQYVRRHEKNMHMNWCGGGGMRWEGPKEEKGKKKKE